MAEKNEAFDDIDETDFGGSEEVEEVDKTNRKSQERISIDSNIELDKDGIPKPYAGMPAEILLLHSRKKGWVIGRLVGWIGKIRDLYSRSKLYSSGTDCIWMFNWTFNYNNR